VPHPSAIFHRSVQRVSGSDVSRLPRLLLAPWSRDHGQVAMARMPASGHETDAQTVRGCSTPQPVLYGLRRMRHGAHAFSPPPRAGHAAPLARGSAACRCTRSCPKRSKVDWLQGCLCRPTQHSSGRVEARAVAGTIPGTICFVPADEAVQMGADGGTDRHVPCVIAIRRVFLPM